MPVYRLIEDVVFPRPDLAEPDGLLAVGGDLSPQRLLAAYRLGIFPWYSDGQPILWWSPDPRLVLEPKHLRVSRKLRQVLRRGRFTVTLDEEFGRVIAACATVPRSGQKGTWITEEMARAYTKLHELGFAHSAEAWLDGELVGGLYGVSLGGCFFGESMFHYRSDASKVALAVLAANLRDWDFHLIDCQMTTPHLLSWGAKEVSRRVFLSLLRAALRRPTLRGKWETSRLVAHP
jgi:leucyl/phenylalanyl-tRNA--protein transferase